MTQNKRNVWEDAYLIDNGACNPVAIAKTFFEHAKEILLENGTDAVRNHPALRLMINQLSSLMGIGEMDFSYLEVYNQVKNHLSPDFLKRVGQ
jgi:hypothetical protein